MSDIEETNRVVRLAKSHTDLALLVCRIPVDQICFVSYGDASGGGTRAEQAQARNVIMFVDMSSSVTLVSWRSHRVKRVVASASAAEAMGLSEAIALCAESARMARTKRRAASHVGHGLEGQLRSLTQRNNRPQ